MSLLALISILHVFSYKHITPQSVFMLNCFFIQNFTLKFKSTGRATLHTILIDRQAFYSTRASGLQTNSQTDFNIMKCKKDTKKPEEQCFCYNSTSFTNHRASLEKCTHNHSFISTKHIDATILKYICKYSQSWDLRHRKIQLRTHFVSFFRRSCLSSLLTYISV